MDKDLAKRIREVIEPAAKALGWFSDEQLRNSTERDPYWNLRLHANDILAIRRLYWELGGETTRQDYQGEKS